MKFSHFLHIYQPHDQHPGTLEKIVNESYRPLLLNALKVPETRITLNVNAVLTELLFKNGYRDVIDNIKALVEMGRLELTGSAKFHAFLPLLPEDEIVRQIELNHETNSRYFGGAFNPKGFFSPEMAYSPKVASVVKELGYKWILADEMAMGDDETAINNEIIYKIKGLDLMVFFREKRPSNVIMGALVRSAHSLKKAIQGHISKDGYVITAMDGETFGHHRPGLVEAFFEIVASKDFENAFISDLPEMYSRVEEVVPRDSTWNSSVKDITDGVPFKLWLDSGNKIHKYGWELADLALRVTNESKYSDKNYPQLLEETHSWDDLSADEKAGEEKKREWLRLRDLLDRALNSDPWWWASAKPWWSVEMIEKGMNLLYKVVTQMSDASDTDRDFAEELYKKILFTAHEWQRRGIVDKMAEEASAERTIPLSKRFGAGAHYDSLLKALRMQEERAVETREYEQAIKWRDAQYKLERDLDIYDAIHIMDLFRAEGDFAKFEEILAEHKGKYRRLTRGQPH